MLHAIAMHPFMVTMTDITMKSIPVESKNRKGRKSLHKIVKWGEQEYDKSVPAYKIRVFFDIFRQIVVRI